jgi:hypothetical protein
MVSPERRRCRTCEQTLDVAAFYENCSECKDCKRIGPGGTVSSRPASSPPSSGSWTS